MTDQKTIDVITARLTGKCIRIYERDGLRPAYVVSTAGNSQLNAWTYSIRSTTARWNAYTKAKAFANAEHLITGYPIVDDTL